MGRNTLYTRELSDEVCRRMADGETLNQICRSEHMPARTTIIGWQLEDRDGFSDRYARAKDAQIDYWADEITEISDNGTNDWIERETEAGRMQTSYNGDHVQRSRLRTDSRKWLLAKLKPERYGEKLELSGNLEMKMPDEQLDSRVALLLRKAGIATSVGGEGETPDEA